MKKSYLTVTDQFCGAGGSSIGAVAAGVEITQALNHWKRAIETYATNHPNTYVDCTDISACDPRRYLATDILITSPECTNHSLAKGRQRKLQAQLDLFGRVTVDPTEERSRATMWDVPRFAEIHKYRVIIVENVVDARHWVLFNDWLRAMNTLGYNHEIVYLNSMFAHPTPQSRDRMYVILTDKGNPKPDLNFTPLAWCQQCECDVNAVQSWKNQLKKWGRYGPRRQYVYRCPTCTNEVIPYYYCAANAIDWSIPSERIGDRQKPLKEKTMERIRVGLERYGQYPFMVAPGGRQNGENSALWRAFPTQTGTPTFGLVSPFLVDLGHTHADHPGKVHSVIDGIPTQTSRQTLGLAFVVSVRGEPQYNVLSITDVLPTQTTTGAPYLASFIVSMRDSPDYPLKDIIEPLPTQSTVGTPYLVELHGTSGAKPIDDPLGCILANGNHHGLVMPQPFIISYYSGSDQTGKVTDPLATVSTHDRHGLITPPFIMSYYNNRKSGAAVSPLTNPAPTVPAMAVHYLVEPQQASAVEDCHFRMLKSHEIGRAMAFPDTYTVIGNEREKVKQYGNAVTPPVMSWLVQQCIKSLEE